MAGLTGARGVGFGSGVGNVNGHAFDDVVLAAKSLKETRFKLWFQGEQVVVHKEMAINFLLLASAIFCQ